MQRLPVLLFLGKLVMSDTPSYAQSEKGALNVQENAQSQLL